MDIKQILQQNNFRFNKQFGQNFLTDSTLLASVVADSGITANDVVLEIGAGAGTLTRALSKVAKQVIAFEIDKNLKKILDITLADCNNVQVVMGDVMRYSMEQLHDLVGNKPFKVVANIPYYITTPLIMRFVEESNLVQSLTLTIQKEVAERLNSDHNCKDYGAITVAVQAVADVEILQVLGRELFYPAPNVDSAVVNVVFRRNKFDIEDSAFFRKTVKNSFAMRRKTLVNNLMNAFKLTREVAEGILQQMGLPATIRGEALSVGQFVELAKVLKNSVL
ncbi:MAG: ribosomal RNA small subunit methyltransferase A [Clostridia bacterium]|nr:ribosomal RNA small subunit methyltransferase A [Clostridia bacterium]